MKIDLKEVGENTSSLSIELAGIVSNINSRVEKKPTFPEFVRILEIQREAAQLLERVTIDYPERFEQALIKIGNIPIAQFSRYGEPYDSYIRTIVMLTAVCY